jgi:hypothetical protein
VKPVPVTVNCVFPLPTGTAAGEMEKSAGGGFVIVTDADADCAGLFELAAVTVTVLGDGSVVGAVYSPVLLITPNAKLPPAAPFTDHEMPPLPPLTVAENWICPMSATCAV